MTSNDAFAAVIAELDALRPIRYIWRMSMQDSSPTPCSDVFKIRVYYTFVDDNGSHSDSAIYMVTRHGVELF